MNITDPNDPAMAALNGNTEMSPLAPDGDLVLIPGSPAACRIRVWSQRVVEVSPFFANMLKKGHFMEGQFERPSQRPQPLLLPEADAWVLLTICHSVRNVLLTLKALNFPPTILCSLINIIYNTKYHNSHDISCYPAVISNLILLAGSPPLFKPIKSSEWLFEASSIFKRMLTSRFAKGQIQRSPRAPHLLLLHDETAQAISALCHLLYHKATEIAGKWLPAERIFELVVAADKYDMMDTLRLQIQSLAKRHFDGLNKLSWENSTLRAGAMYLLRDTKVFRLGAKQLIVHFNQPLSGLRKFSGAELLPPTALLAMAEKRAKAQRMISTGLASTDSTDCKCCGYEGVCEYREELSALFDACLWRPSFEPLTSKTLAQILEKLKQKKYVIGTDKFPRDGVDRGDAGDVAEEVERICRVCVWSACVSISWRSVMRSVSTRAKK